jgi:hypothetical protein
MLPAVRRHAARTLLSLALLAQAPAWAGGPFQPPDGVGNPNGADYTGYQVVGYVHGVRHQAGVVRTTFYCTNMGGADADGLVAQFYDHIGDPSRAPLAVSSYGVPVTVSGIGALSTTTATGTPPVFGLARILVHDGVKKKNPLIACQALAESPIDGAPLAGLAVQPAAKSRKKQ